MLILGEKDVMSLVGSMPPTEIFKTIGSALYAIAHPSDKCKAENPARIGVNTPSHRVLFKPSAVLRTDDQGHTDASVVMKCVSSPWDGAGVPGTALIVGGTSGAVEAVMNVGKLNGPRTSAGTALVVQMFGNQQAETMTVFGSGLQAFWHIKFITSIIPSIKNISIISRNQTYQAKFIEELKTCFPDLSFQGADQSEVGQVRPLVSAADIVVCCSAVNDLYLFDIAWLKPNAHVYDVGTYTDSPRGPYDGQALMAATSADSSPPCQTLILDSYDGCVPESKDLAFIVNDPSQYRHRCVDLGDLVLEDGSVDKEAVSKVDTGRIVWYRSAGVAAMDNLICQKIYKEAKERGMGTTVASY